MIESFAAVQPAVVGAVLAWAGGVKLFGSGAAALARRTALGRLAGPHRAVPVYRTVGSVELGAGAVLVLPPALAAEAVLATVLCAGLLGYLGYARLVAPDSPCGCLSERPTPVRWRGFARATVLLAASGTAAWFGGHLTWADALVGRPMAAGTLLLAEVVLVLALSPELDAHWLLPLRRLRLRWRHPLAGTASGNGVPVAASVQQLLRSPAYRIAGGWLRSDVLDSWDEDEWRVLSYSARHGEAPVTAVFAVPRLRFRPADVRAVLVDEHTGDVLWQYTPQRSPHRGTALVRVDGPSA